VKAVLSVALLVLAAHACAEDGFKWNPAERRVAAKGTKFREELAKTDQRTLKFVVEGRAREEKHEGTEKIQLVHSIGAVASAGVVEDTISVAAWSRAWDGDADESLEGATLTVTGEGNYRTCAIESGRTVTRAANAWIQTHIVKNGHGEPALDELDWDFILPKEPVADGGSWTLDPVAFAKEVMGARTVIDAKKSSGTGKLTKVKVENGVHFGHIEVTVSLALETLGQSKVRWRKGGVQEFRYVLDVSLEPRRKDGVSGVITIELAGEGTVEPPGGDPLELEIDEKSRLEMRRSPLE
jgi:hypothetical protein